MRKLAIFIMLIGLGVLTPAQKVSNEQKKNYTEQKQRAEEQKRKFDKDFEKLIKLEKEKFSKEFENMSPEEKRKFFHRIQVQRMIEELKISIEKQKTSKKLLEKYFETRDSIMEQFQPDKINPDISEDELKENIKKSLEVAQKLLDMKKEYMDKFLKEFKPHQVIKIYKLEKEMIHHLKKHREKKEIKR